MPRALLDDELLGDDEPAAFRLVNPHASRALVFCCDHASNFIPRSLNGLGLCTHDLHTHRAYDIGIKAVADSLSARFGCRTILSHFSRLVIDPNRKLNHETLIATQSDGLVIPANLDLSPAQRQARLETFYHPYHGALASLLDDLKLSGQVPVLVSLHSMTDELGGEKRPWPVCAIWNRDPRLAAPFMAAWDKRDIPCGDNLPYDGRDGHGYTTEIHGDANGYASLVVELRQDLIADRSGSRHWAGLLGDALDDILDNPDLCRIQHY